MKARPQGAQGAMQVLRRGLTTSPELRKGALYTVLLAIAGAGGALLVPVLLQQVLDRGLIGGFEPSVVYPACAVAAAAVVAVYLAGRAAHVRMVEASEAALKDLRVRAFEHIHRLSIAEQQNVKRGTLVARVTADVDTIGEFLEWAGIVWITAPSLLLGSLLVMFVYSWRLALVVILVMLPLWAVMRRLQKGLLAAYDRVRTTVADTLSEISESVMGAAVIRAYDLEQRMDVRLKSAIERQYRAQIAANRYQAIIFPTSDVFGALALGAALGVGVWLGPRWGMTAGDLVAFLFLVGLFQQPLGELSETFDHTQTAIAAWSKVLSVLDIPIDMQEPADGVELPPGPVSVSVHGLWFSYSDGDPVLKDIDVEIARGTQTVVVGQTGCGKTTFAKLLCRLADPTRGRVSVDGIDLRDVTPASRRRSIRMVPQDGFLFDASIRDNVAYGLHGAADAEIRGAFWELGLGDWVESLPDGLDTRVGQRGEELSVGERQFVALARAHIADPGLLILDEATSAVDPRTERTLTEALRRVSAGRTTITIAHRLSTARTAGLVLVFDEGRLVERGTHPDLIKRAGVYARLYESWLGNVMEAPMPDSPRRA